MRQTPRSAPTPDPATARHRRHTAADAARPPPRTGSTPPTRRGTDPGLRRRSSRTRSPWPAAAAPEASRAGRAAARTADADWRRPAPCPTAPPPPGRRSASGADAIRYSNSAVFPIPASPRSTSDRLSPRRIAETRSSSSAHSLARPRRPAGPPGPRERPSIASDPRRHEPPIADFNAKGDERVPSPLRRRSTRSLATPSTAPWRPSPRLLDPRRLRRGPTRVSEGDALSGQPWATRV